MLGNWRRDGFPGDENAEMKQKANKREEWAL